MAYVSNVFRFNTDEILDGSRLEMWYGNLPLINAPSAGEIFTDWYFYIPEVDEHYLEEVRITMIKLKTGQEKTYTLTNLPATGGRVHVAVEGEDNSEIIVEADIKFGQNIMTMIYSFVSNHYIQNPLTLTNAYNFTDEGNAEVIYDYSSIPYRWETYLGILKPGMNPANEFPYLESLDENCLIYTDLNIREDREGTGIYEWEFTDVERELLRNTYNKAITNTVWFTTLERYENDEYDYEVSINNDDYEEAYGENYCISYIDTNFTIVNANPVFVEATVKDVNSTTVALTGDEDVIVLNESMVEYHFDVVASKGATITDYWVECGGTRYDGSEIGIIDDPTDNTFYFWATDSRGKKVGKLVSKEYVDYFKPTCYQTVSAMLSEEKTAEFTIEIEGSYYKGYFDRREEMPNGLLLEYRYGEKNGTMGAWTRITDTPTFNEGKYELTIKLDGFPYEKAYVFQCRAIDMLNTVISSQYTIKLLPVYDWSEEDFNLNVPLKINGETVLRHNEEANNTVLSASGGHIYIRPAGTDNTTGETIIYPDGSVKLGGSLSFEDGVDFGESAEIKSAVNFANTADFTEKVNFNGAVNFDRVPNITFGDTWTLSDVVIESGSESMGSNGTWYWHKWASGYVECWGCRNFGKMAVTTTWGNLYRSAVQTQSLPSGLFSEAPTVININMINSDFGGWICKHENTAPSATSTGSFIYVRPASATTSSSYISFYVAGYWV